MITRVRKNLAELDRQLGTEKILRRLDVEAGWYAVLRIPATQSDEDLAIDLLNRKGVYVHPGHFYDFPSDGFLVVSLITQGRGICGGGETPAFNFSVRSGRELCVQSVPAQSAEREVSAAARRIRRLRNPNLQVRASALGHSGWHQLRNANPAIHFQMLFRAARTISLSRFVIALAREFVAAANAVAVSGDRSRFDGYQSHEDLSVIVARESYLRAAQDARRQQRRPNTKGANGELSSR